LKLKKKIVLFYVYNLHVGGQYKREIWFYSNVRFKGRVTVMKRKFKTVIINNSVNINLSGQLPHLSNPLTKISPRHIR
jgi:hypothetical protein